MGIILKYIVRSMLEKKLRTLLVIMAVGLSGALFLASINLSDSITRNYEAKMKEMMGDIDVTVSRGEHSPSGFINEKLLQGREKDWECIPVVSSIARYKTGTKTYDMISLAGMALEDYERINHLEGIASIDAAGFMGRKMIVSKVTAEKYGLAAGDKITLLINGQKADYTIFAIANKQGIFAEDEKMSMGLVPLTALSRLIGGEGRPTALYLRLVNRNLEEQQKTKQVTDELSFLKKLYARYKVEEAFDREIYKASLSWIIQPFLLMTAVVAFISGFIVFSTFKVIMLEKLSAVGTFRSIGASKAGMSGVLFLEAAFYGMIGGGLALAAGTLLLRLLTGTMGTAMESGSSSIVLRPVTLLETFIFSVVVAVLSAMLPILGAAKLTLKEILLGNHKEKEMHVIKKVSAGLVWCAAGVRLAQIDEIGWSIVCSISGIMCMIVGMILVMPGVAALSSWLLDKLFSLLFGNIGSLAVKNIKKDKSILNSMTLITIGFTVMLMVSTVTQNILDQVINAYDTTYHTDIEIEAENINKKKVHQIKSTKGVKEVLPLAEIRKIKSPQMPDYSVTVLGVQDSSLADSLDFNIQKQAGKTEKDILKGLQEDRKVLVSKHIARKFKLRMGDEIELAFDKGTKTYQISGFTDALYNNGALCLIAMKYYQLDTGYKAYNDVYVKLDTGSSLSETMEKLKGCFEEEASSIASIDEMKEANIADNAQLMNMINLFAVLAVIIGVVGIINNLLISFIERKKQLAVLRSIGMSKVQLIQMNVIEALGSGMIGSFGGLLGACLILKEIGYVFEALNIPIKPACVPILFVVYFAGGVAVNLLGTLLPARSAAGIKIVEAIKCE